MLHEHPYRSGLQTIENDVTNYFRSEAIDVRKMAENDASDGFEALSGISRERFKRGSRNSTSLSRTVGPINVPHITSLGGSGRLQNTIEYCRDCKVECCRCKTANISAKRACHFIYLSRTTLSRPLQKPDSIGSSHIAALSL